MVFPSLYEGFGLPVLEAMAAGCPVLASSAASLPEVCGDATLLFDPERPEAIAAVMRRLIFEPDLADRLRGLGRKQAALFTWERSASATSDFIDRLLSV
jgi:glycosyltransferase involved in cell wall biosynthesis